MKMALNYLSYTRAHTHTFQKTQEKNKCMFSGWFQMSQCYRPKDQWTKEGNYGMLY